jgi:PncC family amidohydrolase
MDFNKLYYKAFDLVDELKACDVKVAFAESLTGGMISSKLVDVPGASDVFVGSVVSYTNDIKMNVLGVKPETIEEHTEVSPECAGEMAEGVRKLMGADIAFSATGYAGGYSSGADLPDEEDSETGTVCFGFATEDGTDTYTQFFVGDREDIRLQSVKFVFDMILDYLKENYE